MAGIQNGKAQASWWRCNKKRHKLSWNGNEQIVPGSLA